MVTEERLSPSARSVQIPGDNPATIHSIEAILGFKEETIFQKSASYSLTNKVPGKGDRNVIVAPMKKSHSSESFDSKGSTFFHIPGLIYSTHCQLYQLFFSWNNEKHKLRSIS